MTLIRDAHGCDAGGVAAILSGFIDGTPWMPRVHTLAEDLSFAGLMVDRGWVRVAEAEDEIAGFLAEQDGMIHALYVVPDHCGRGLGKALLDDAKAGAQALDLYVFQANTGAQRFYRREGFAEVARSDGSGNDEGLPDIRMRWTRNQTEAPA